MWVYFVTKNKIQNQKFDLFWVYLEKAPVHSGGFWHLTGVTSTQSHWVNRHFKNGRRSGSAAAVNVFLSPENKNAEDPAGGTFPAAVANPQTAFYYGDGNIQVNRKVESEKGKNSCEGWKSDQEQQEENFYQCVWL